VVIWLADSTLLHVNVANAIGYQYNEAQQFTTLWAEQIPINFFF
jgi:hypothetical protein